MDELTRCMEELTEYINGLTDEERKKQFDEWEELHRKQMIHYDAFSLAYDGYLLEDTEIGRNQHLFFEEGEHSVYVWKHLNGDPFYIGSGKEGRSRDISRGRPPRFYAELLAFDAVLCYVAIGVSEQDARFIEHYCSFSVSANGINLTNRDFNTFNMSDASKALWAKRFAAQEAKAAFIDSQLKRVLEKTHNQPNHGDVVMSLWREYGTLNCLRNKDNYWRAIEALNSESPLCEL